MDLPDNNNIVKKLEKDDRLDFDAILEKGKRLYVNKNIYLNLYSEIVSCIFFKDYSTTIFIIIIFIKIGIGLFGPWQMKMAALLFLVSMANGITVFVYTFTG